MDYLLQLIRDKFLYLAYFFFFCGYLRAWSQPLPGLPFHLGTIQMSLRRRGSICINEERDDVNRTRWQRLKVPRHKRPATPATVLVGRRRSWCGSARGGKRERARGPELPSWCGSARPELHAAVRKVAAVAEGALAVLLPFQTQPCLEVARPPTLELYFVVDPTNHGD